MLIHTCIILLDLNNTATVYDPVHIEFPKDTDSKSLALYYSVAENRITQGSVKGQWWQNLYKQSGCEWKGNCTPLLSASTMSMIRAQRGQLKQRALLCISAENRYGTARSSAPSSNSVCSDTNLQFKHSLENVWQRLGEVTSSHTVWPWYCVLAGGWHHPVCTVQFSMGVSLRTISSTKPSPSLKTSVPV